LDTPIEDIIVEEQQQCIETVYQNADSAICCDAPALDHEFLTANKELIGTVQVIAGPSKEETSYFWITFDQNADKGGVFAGLSIHAWCVDLSRYMYPGAHSFDVFSTYDDWNYDEALDSPELLPNVNWLINHYKIGEEVTVPAGYCGAEEATFTLEWQTYQNTMWQIIDKGMTANGVYSNGGGIVCVEDFLASEALTKGNGYEPSCMDENAEVAILLVVDDDTADNTIQRQVLIGEVPLSSLPGACTDQQCCQELEVDHELFQENKEIAVQFTKGGGSDDGAAWDVAFSAGDHIFSGLSAEAWSVDLDRDLTDGSYMVDTYSAYDNWYRFNAIDKKHNIPLVNWLINHLPDGTEVPASQGCSAATVSINDFQNAIWDLVDHDSSTRLSGDDCVRAWLVEEAKSQGVDYEPSCEDAVDSKIAVLLIIDADGTEKLKATTTGALKTSEGQHIQYVANQILIAIISLSDIDASCVMKECPCCEVDTELFEPEEYCEYKGIDFASDDEGYATGNAYVFPSSYAAYGLQFSAQREGDAEPIPAYYHSSGDSDAGKVVIVPTDPTKAGTGGDGMNPFGGDILINIDQTQGDGMKIDLYNVEAGATVTAKDEYGNVIGDPIPVAAKDGIQSVRIGILGVAQVAVSLEGLGAVSMVHVCHDPYKTPAPFGVGFAPPTPSEAPKTELLIVEEPHGGGSYGDPHLKTWTGRVYDFHGECDLLLAKSLAFGNGLGFEVQIRTDIRDDWSFISRVAVKIGEDLMEVQSGGLYSINEVEEADLKTTNLAGFKVRKHGGEKDNGTVKTRFHINLEEHGILEIKVYNEFVSVLIREVKAEDFHDSVGLMGTFQDGQLVGRDQSTVFQDANEFGLEWQVRDTDSMLFQEARFPQFPAKCTMPAIPSLNHRRLSQEVAGGAGMIPLSEAEKACENLPVEDRDACVYDVLTTGDLAMADLDAFDDDDEE